jgi:hypothetical protein
MAKRSGVGDLLVHICLTESEVVILCLFVDYVTCADERVHVHVPRPTN